MTKRYLIVSLFMIGILSIFAIMYMTWPKKAQQPRSTSSEERSLFSATNTTSWTQGPSSRTDMVLFAPKEDTAASGCFTAIEYKTGAVDPATQAIQLAQQYKKDGLPISQFAQTSQILASDHAPLSYTLNHYRIDSANDTTMQGLALGYISLESHHIEIEAHCETAEALTSTIPALNSYVFHTP